MAGNTQRCVTSYEKPSHLPPKIPEESPQFPRLPTSAGERQYNRPLPRCDRHIVGASGFADLRRSSVQRTGLQIALRQRTWSAFEDANVNSVRVNSGFHEPSKTSSFELRSFEPGRGMSQFVDPRYGDSLAGQSKHGHVLGTFNSYLLHLVRR